MGYIVTIRDKAGVGPHFEREEIGSVELNILQARVDGLIEAMFTIPSPSGVRNHSITGYVNEEGLLIGLPVWGAVDDEHGVRPFAGDMVVCGLNERTGDSRLLTSDEVDWLEARWHTYGVLDLNTGSDD